MNKFKCISIILSIILCVLIALPVISNAEESDVIKVTRDVYSNNGSMKFTFSGLDLDTNHEYEFGLSSTMGATVEDWFKITDYTATTAVVDILTTTKEMRDIVNITNTGYITIKDATDDTIVMDKCIVDLKIPYLLVTNKTIITNGTQYGTGTTQGISVGIRNANNSEAYYQYVKIDDQEIIKKYQELKESGGDMMELKDMLTLSEPTSNWTPWEYWNGHSSDGLNGYGYPQKTISAPGQGLYYLWVYFSGENIKNVYGYALVVNLDSYVPVESVSLPARASVTLGGALKLTPQFNPSTATNKIVTWTSSDESVATVDNNGNITPKKVGSTIITVTTQDGNKTATCTVTVTANDNNSNSGNNSGNNNNNGNSSGSNNNSSGNNSNNNDNTVAQGMLPQTGQTIVAIVTIVIAGIVGIILHIKSKKLKDIK